MASQKQPHERVGEETLIGLPVDWMARSPLHKISVEPPNSDEALIGIQQRFKVRFANCAGGRESAGVLVKKMYATRGYPAKTGPLHPERITLVANVDHSVIGTLTVGLGRSAPLLAEELYSNEIAELRDQGCEVCEYTRLAIDGQVRSQRVIASLFHIGYLYPHSVLGYTDGVLEVNPRHVGFYKRMLGFTQIGPERTCARVKAPAVLLRTNFAYMSEQVQAMGGRCERGPGSRSLYPFFFSPEDEAGIIARLTRDPD
ncbi:MAG: long-chain N-acyl amino acid synthase [Burkholderiales bacterium]|nr:long-chain N-acyl amino acid synthase [Burkholderiales bacterium]